MEAVVCFHTELEAGQEKVFGFWRRYPHVIFGCVHRVWSGKPYFPAGFMLQHRTPSQISQDNLNQLRLWLALSCANGKV